MRNIFDQYEHPENRLTHALGCALHEDARLLRGFVFRCTGQRFRGRDGLHIVEQYVPGDVADSDLDERRGLPDLWIYADSRWALLIESKVAAPVRTDQLRRHVRTAQRAGFDAPHLLVISPTRPARLWPEARHLTWTEVYRWMRDRRADSKWAYRFVDYIEIAEAKMFADGYLGDKTLTEFDGIPFDAEHPYNYREAKRVLRLLMQELRRNQKLIDLGVESSAEGRPAITGRGGGLVWDFLRLKAASGSTSFTSHPHPTVAIKEKQTLTIISVPNGISPRFRRNLVGAGFDGFQRLLLDVAKRIERSILDIDGAFPFVEVIQRHYPSQRSNPVEDAVLEFDLRTASPTGSSRVKFQEQWLRTAFDVLLHKNSNIQFGVGAAFPYGSKRLRERAIIDTFADVWVGCKPLLDRLLGVG